MGLLSFFKRQPEASADAPAAAAEPDAVAAARTRARRRLLGATVLLGLGVIGFPLLFETQPRPIPVNIPIEIPRKDGAAALALPASAPPLSRASAAVVEEPAAAPAEIVERAGEQGRDVAASAAAAAAPPAPVAVNKAAAIAPPKPTPAANPAAVAASKPADDGARARALLEGQAAASAPSTRVVVQVGAYSDPTKLGEARQKVEKLGFKTYTQVVDNEAGQRTRVRVGPFATRAEADKAAARIKAAGLPAAILTL